MKTHNAPSRARLIKELGLTTAQADLVRALIKNTVRTTNADLFPAANACFAACYNMPSFAERRMECLNEVIGGHGVEALGDGMYPDALYVNTGDTYSPTLLYCYKRSTFRLTTWGDYVEKNNL